MPLDANVKTTWQRWGWAACSRAGLRPAVLVLACLLACRGWAGPAPALPNINTNNVLTITNAPYGAVGDGATDNTAAIQAAITAAAAGPATNGLSGGTVRVPAPGIFLSGPLAFKSKVNLQIDAGATLRMLPLALFTNLSNGGNGLTYGDLLYAKSLSDLEISGSGAIDGQGADWWPTALSRPYLIYFNSGCQRVLVQDVTILNAPAQNIVFKGSGGNITIQRITESAPPSSGVANPSHNTDGVDLAGTNILVQGCSISVGDDNIALGSSAAATAGVLITNCAFGTGHGVSIGSNTEGGVSNLTVVNCTFNATEYGIRMKSDNASSGGGGQGGLAQNLSYLNLGMTNISIAPIVIYSYYEEYGTPAGITPATAAAQPVPSPVPATTARWQNINISNLTATVAPGGIAGVVWGRTEMPISNLTLNHVNITAPATFDIYNARGVAFVDSQVAVPGANATFTLYNADVTLTNSAFGAGLVTLDGLTSTNSLALCRAPAAMNAGDALGANPITLSASTLSISNDLSLPGSTVLNFALGTNDARVVVTGNLNLNAAINLTNSGGFTVTNYVLFGYAGNLRGNPVLGATPANFPGYGFRLDTNVPGQVVLSVSPPSPPVFGSISAAGKNVLISGAGGASNASFYLLTTTNLALPSSNWTRLATNPFAAGGTFAITLTNGVAPAPSQRFYRLQLLPP
jgi:polygalacturonase